MAVNSPYSEGQRTVGREARGIPIRPLSVLPACVRRCCWVQVVGHTHAHRGAPLSIEVSSKTEENSKTASSFVHPVGIACF
jgi:hypothetical protein